MRQLRLVGIHENGESLHLSSKDGNSFELPIDEALRSALTRAVRSDHSETPVALLSPREIQTRIRSGATADEVAAESGMPLERIMRYEGPVRAERDYIASQARNVEVSAPQTHESYRSIFGEEPANLGEMVAYRVRCLGIENETVQWDAWRVSDGSWEVVARFELPDADTSISLDPGSEESLAKWTFHPNRKSLQNANRWAQVLSELEPLDGPVGARRLTAVADHPFDIEADGEESDFESVVDDSEQLLDVLSARRGQRLGIDEESDDALASMISRAPHPEDDPRLADPEPQDEDLPRLYDGVSTRTTSISLVPSPQPAAADPSTGEEESAGEEESGGKKKIKRSSVPSWDEIVFGRRNNND